MGYTKHHAIIVSSWNREKLIEVNEYALSVFGCQVTGVCKSIINTDYSFLIGPDGLKEDWSESDDGDNKRFDFIVWLENHCYEDGSSCISYVEVSYNDDKASPKIINYSK